eukprot:447920_1
MATSWSPPLRHKLSKKQISSGNLRNFPVNNEDEINKLSNDILSKQDIFDAFPKYQTINDIQNQSMNLSHFYDTIWNQNPSHKIFHFGEKISKNALTTTIFPFVKLFGLPKDDEYKNIDVSSFESDTMKNIHNIKMKDFSDTIGLTWIYYVAMECEKSIKISINTSKSQKNSVIGELFRNHLQFYVNKNEKKYNDLSYTAIMRMFHLLIQNVNHGNTSNFKFILIIPIITPQSMLLEGHISKEQIGFIPVVQSTHKL